MATRPASAPDDPKVDAGQAGPPWPVPRLRARHLPARPANARAEGDDGPALVRRLAVAELAEGLAHDLKNQLTVVAASVQLARDVPGSGRDELLERAWRSAMRAARLMDEMLRYAQGGACAEDDVDACEALETAVAGAWGYCGARGVQLEMRLESGLPRVRGAAPALRILLLHLLRWVGDRCPAECRLVAEASVRHGGVTVRLIARSADNVEVEVAPVGGQDAEGLAASVLEALAAEVGAVLDLGPSGPSAWLRPAGDAAGMG